MNSLLPQTVSARRDLALASAAVLAVLVFSAVFHPCAAWIAWVAAAAPTRLGAPPLAELPVDFAFLGFTFGWYAQRRRREALQQSEARCAAIIEIADDAIISIDGDGRVQLFNDGAETIFGYSASEVLGRPIEVLLPERFRAAHHRHVAAFEGSGDVSRKMHKRGELVGLRKDGSEFPAMASISRLGSGADTIFTVILHDLTDRKRAEQALKESEAHLRQAARTARLGHWIWNDTEKRFDHCSPDLASLFGYSVEEFLTRFDEPGGGRVEIHPDDRGLYAEAIRSSLEERRSYDLELRMRVADG